MTFYEWHYGINNKTPRGWASLACLVLIMSAVQMISLGIIGEYLARIFLEVKGRPTFLIGSIVEGRDATPTPTPTTAPTTKSEPNAAREDARPAAGHGKGHRSRRG